MRTLACSIGIAWAAAAPLVAAPAQAVDSVIRFANGDQLSGAVRALDAASLVCDSPVLERPTPFRLGEVLDLTLPGEVPRIAADHEATVTLTNGDVVRGQLAAVDDAGVSVDTWFAGRLVLNRLMVAGVKIDSQTRHSYRGPNGTEGWIQSQDPGVWSYKRGAFVSGGRGGIARKDLLGEECAVGFDLEWKGESVGLKLMLFSSDPSDETPSSGYEISFQGGSIYMRNCKTQKYLGSAHSVAMAEQDRSRIEVRASRKSGKFCVLVDKRPIEVWTDPDFAEAGKGTCLHFVAIEDGVPLRVSDIVVGPWDGTIRELPAPRGGMRFGVLPVPGGEADGDGQEAPAAKDAPPPEDRMELANGDALEGEVTSISEGMISVKTPLGDYRLPVGRLRSVALPKVDLERAIRRNGDVRAWLADGGSLVFRLDAFDAESLTGSSQNFGTATFRRDAFSRLEFNIYDPVLEDKRAASDW